MAERFERLYKLPDNLYTNESPIIISAGVLLKDNDTGSVVVQLKFQSVSPKSIKAVKISLSAYDVSGAEIQGAQDFQYLDLNIYNGQDFGSNRAIIMPAAVTRRVSVQSVTVVFSDESSWKNTDAYCPLPTSNVLEQHFGDAELAKQYRLCTNDAARVTPVEEGSLWRCSCGVWNGGSSCTNCRISKETVFTKLELALLNEQKSARLAEEKQQREEQARIAAENAAEQREIDAAKQQAARKRNKIIAIIGTPLLAIALLFVLWINPQIIQPSLKYSDALDLLEAAQYEDAYKHFFELGDYKDSKAYLDAFEWICVEEYASGDYRSTFEYDEHGKVIKHFKNYYEYETLDTTYCYTYDDSGKLTKTTKKDDDGEIDSTTTYIYNDAGLLIEEHDDWTYYEYLTKYSYDENGYLVYEEYFSRDKDEGPDFVLSTKITYVNDSEGKMIEKTVINEKDKETKYQYAYDQNGLCVEWIRLSDQKVYKYNRIFDDYGRVASCVETRLDGSTQKITYKYALVFHEERFAILSDPELVYREAEQLAADGQYKKAILKFKSLGDYKDCDERVVEIHNLVAEEEYNAAVSLFENGKYEEAISAFEGLGNYKDCSNRIKDAKYAQADQFLGAGRYDDAIALFAELGEYKDSENRIQDAEKQKYPAEYAKAEKLVLEGKFAEAAIAFGKIGNYSNAGSRANELWQRVMKRTSTLSAGYFATIGLKTDGRVVVAGENSYGSLQWTDIIAVSGGNSIIAGLKSDGTVVVDGYEAENRYDVSSWNNIVSVSAGSSHVVGLKNDGTVVATGLNDSGECNVSNWTDIIDISAGNGYTIGLKVDGTVVAIGNNGDNQCDVSDWTGIISVSAGSFHTVGLKANGTAVATGANGDKQCDVSKWTNIIAISAGRNQTIGLKEDGSVVAVGEKQYGKCNVSSWTNVVAISANNHHTVALLSDGTVVAVGYNKYGQINVEDWRGIKLPD